MEDTSLRVKQLLQLEFALHVVTCSLKALIRL